MKILHEVKEIEEEIIGWRRHFHKYPETGMHLPETENFIKNILNDIGITIQEEYNGPGISALIKGIKPGKTIAIRADMDALNLEEQNSFEYKSKVNSKMHACGHDAHMAMALGAGEFLYDNRNEFEGNVKIIFQPGEEIGQGAKEMIYNDVLKINPKIDAIIGTHIGNFWSLKSGTIGYRKGPMMAASDMIIIKIIGEGGHSSSPHETIDSLLAGAKIVDNLQSIVSHKIDPLDSVVISIGEFFSGTASNIISDKTRITGSVRCLKEKTREKIPDLIEEVISGICYSMGAEYEYQYLKGVSVLNSNKQMIESFKNIAQDLIGNDNVIEIDEPVMGGEDMAYFLNEIPGVFFGLGSIKGESTKIPHHNSKFKIDEDVLSLGTALLSQYAIFWLNNN